MTTDAVMSETQWRETLISIAEEDAKSPTKIRDLYPRHIYSRVSHVMISEDSDIDTTENYSFTGYNVNITDEEYYGAIAEHEKKVSEQRNSLLMRMRPLFDIEPKFEIICKDLSNRFLDSGFTDYAFRCKMNESDKTIIPNDLKYMINLCGFNLTVLSMDGYSYSQIMPLIKSNCPNLKNLFLEFKEIESKDFENVFSNMSQLKSLNIRWNCKDSNLPMTLIESLAQVCETLKHFSITCNAKKCYPLDSPDSPDSSVEVIPPENESLMAVVSSMKNLERVVMRLDHSVTDEFLITLANNSKNLKELFISGSNITDKGIIALNNLNQLQVFSLLLSKSNENKFITDQSIKCLVNKAIKTLNLSNCINICSNSSIVELIKGLPNLKNLNLQNTKVTFEDVEETCDLAECREIKLNISVSFEVPDDFRYETKSNITCSGIILND